MNAPASQTVESLKEFLGRFDEFKQEEQEDFAGIKEFLNRFEIEWPRLKREEEDWKIRTAPDFNIFSVLKIERREVKLHTRFIAELLDPSGSHGQRDLFLKFFFEKAASCGLKPPEKLEWEWEVKIEEPINVEREEKESRRLDIVLRCPNAKFIAVIENKIDAEEQPEQLSTYLRWLEFEDQKSSYSERNLIFLTLDGGCSKEPEATRISQDKYVCLSYREHVRLWLETCLREVQAPTLRFAIEQYLQIIRKL
jgi:PD-(D/E)XK nuclease superfamily